VIEISPPPTWMSASCSVAKPFEHEGEACSASGSTFSGFSVSKSGST
jgi:hypothetical protein